MAGCAVDFLHNNVPLVLTVTDLSISHLAFFLVFFISFIGFINRWRNSSGPHRYPPPGPPARPIIGNILSFPPTGGWYILTEYKKKYGMSTKKCSSEWLDKGSGHLGDLVFFHGLGNNILVLNSLKVINEFLEKRGDKYSDRPSFTVVGELMGLGQVHFQ